MNTQNKKINKKYSIFSLAEYKFGIEMSVVREVLAPPKLTIIPNVAPHVLGVFNLRGKIICLIDIKQVLGMGISDIKDGNMILLVRYKEDFFGFLVEQVSEFIELDKSDITTLDKNMPNHLTHFLAGKYHTDSTGVVYILNSDLILNPEYIFKDLYQ